MSDGEILESTETMRLRIVIDGDPSNPRHEFERLCHVATVPDRDYVDVDKDAGPYAPAWSYYLSRERPDDYRRDSVVLFMRYVAIAGGVAELHTPHDGPVSVWYLTPEDLEQTNDPVACIKGEQEEYRAWATGEVYGYVIEQRVTWERTDRPGATMQTWEHVDSCYGFYGHEYAVEAGREAWGALTAP